MARSSNLLSRPFHGLRILQPLIPAVNCWASIIRPLCGLKLLFGQSHSNLQLLQSLVHLCQLSFHFFYSADQIENDRGAAKIDPQVPPQTLHATKLDHRAPGQKRFIRSALERFNQTLLCQAHNQRPPGPDGLGDDLARQRFIKIEVSQRHNSFITLPLWIAGKQTGSSPTVREGAQSGWKKPSFTVGLLPRNSHSRRRTSPSLPRVEARSLLQVLKQLSLGGADLFRDHDF